MNVIVLIVLILFGIQDLKDEKLPMEYAADTS